MKQNNVRSYMLYAIGEILLVVIGILIALQVNNWNEERIEKARLTAYYEQIAEELEAAIEINKMSMVETERLIRMNSRSLILLNSAHPDSLNALKYTLGALGTVWDAPMTVPVIRDFLENNLSQVKNVELKKYFRFMQSIMESNQSTNEYLNKQYIEAIEPYFVRNINYQNVALERYQDGLIPGGPENDFSRFKGNMELWNLLTFKLELTQGILRGQKAFEEFATEFITVLRAEI